MGDLKSSYDSTVRHIDELCGSIRDSAQPELVADRIRRNCELAANLIDADRAAQWVADLPDGTRRDWLVTAAKYARWQR